MSTRPAPSPLPPAPMGSRDQILLRLYPGERAELLRRAAKAQIETGEEVNLQRYIRSVLFAPRPRRKNGTFAPTPSD